MDRTPPIAVVGMSGLFPGAADLEQFWQNIVEKVDACAEVPEGRWIARPELMVHRDPLPDKALSKRACLVRDFNFDPHGFDLDPDLLAALDPLYHMALHVGKTAFQSCTGRSLNRLRTGVILAAIVLPTDATSEMAGRLFGTPVLEALFPDETHQPDNILNKHIGFANKVTSLPAAILAKGLGLGAGSYTLDAACGSSLYAVKLACDELRAGRADVMLAGGVSRPDCLYTQVGFSQLRALSPSGRCSPFDEDADGLVVGEGAGMLVLKRLDDAIRHGDTVLGLIRGIGLSNDMRGNLLAPDSEGQVRAMREAYQRAGWSPTDVDLIECHGAGTPVGDLVELNSIHALWGDNGWEKYQCAIGSVKSMIGHLLTAAGAAGMIKTLLALGHKILPPSLNFRKPRSASPLADGPFRVQTDPEAWQRKYPGMPRRAAVSAFGFGGINAHILFEEWDSHTSSKTMQAEPAGSSNTISDTPIPPSHTPIAVIGMAGSFGRYGSLKSFQQAVFSGDSTIRKRPEDRWKNADIAAGKHLDRPDMDGGFIDQVSMTIGEFHIPPKEIPDILPQQLIMLKTAADAMKDAGIPLREERPQMGALIGIDFDFEATNFHLRWYLKEAIEAWRRRRDRPGSSPEENQQIERLLNDIALPLTPVRTLGALGGIVASRIAREFRFGGPSFGVSAEEASGLRALEIGVRSLQQGETDLVLVGAVDLTGDVRRVLIDHAIRPYSTGASVRPFDLRANGFLPGEGAAALVMKRLDQAVEDGDNIYSVIKGIGTASGGGIDPPVPGEDAYVRSLQHAFDEADVPPSSITYIEAHGSGDPEEDACEAASLKRFFSASNGQCAIGSVKPTTGHCGSAAGLASLVKTSLCLHHELIPPLKNYTQGPDDTWENSAFYLPIFSQYWFRDRQDGPRRACTAAMTPDGNCMHVVMEGFETASSTPAIAAEPGIDKTTTEQKHSPAAKPYGLFVVEGDDRGGLIKGLDTLRDHFAAPGAGFDNIDAAAQSWFRANRLDPDKKCAVSLVASSPAQLRNGIDDALQAVESGEVKRANGGCWVGYTPDPLYRTGQVAFVFPGSGNHYVEMGRDLGVYWPEVFRDMDMKTPRLKSQCLPEYYSPFRVSWAPGWEQDARLKIENDPLRMIFGQVVHGGLVYSLLGHFGLHPDAVIGYSLGESAALFATGAWPDRDAMLDRMLNTDLFHTDLAGPCDAARKVWEIPSGEDVDWSAAVVNRSEEKVRHVIGNWPTTRLLIVNTPDECVIGGRKKHVDAAIDALGCEAVFLEGVVTVHCDAVLPVREAYRGLHLFPTSPPESIRFYSCANGRSYVPTRDSAADAILKQATDGFDFPATIAQAYADGVRIFVEVGPQSSCTRMIGKILGDRPHHAVSACVRNENDCLTIMKCLGSLATERVPVDLAPLYGPGTGNDLTPVGDTDAGAPGITLRMGGKAPDPSKILQMIRDEDRGRGAEDGKRKTEDRGLRTEGRRLRAEDGGLKTEDGGLRAESIGQRAVTEAEAPYADLIEEMTESLTATSKAHQQFLDFSDELTRAYSRTFEFQTRLLEVGLQQGGAVDLHEDNAGEPLPEPETGLSTPQQPDDPRNRHLAFTREDCMEFAVGSVARVLGPEFAVADTYDVRVRLPDEPLMLVDRILSVEGEKASMGSGRVVTEHDVLPDAWYLDGNRAPVCISVEAGQADLFLCAYLGIDLKVKGKRAYRLLDATVQFHRGLPTPGDTIRYDIHIDRFVRQGKTFLFFFRFEGFVGDAHLISMTDGCAGFFTKDEIEQSGGIILTEADKQPSSGKKPGDWIDLVPLAPAQYDDAAMACLRKGDLQGAFGPIFQGVQTAESLTLPGGRMHLIDRILWLDPHGGRYGLGIIRAEADIHPDDWFLTCHFMDDMVMPGTLMYECCAHTLRVFLQRIGWVTDQPDVVYEPVTGMPAVLKCRGPVTPETKHVVYEVEIKELGYGPEPYVVADALMYGDGQRIVRFEDMSIKMTGATRKAIETFWNNRPKHPKEMDRPQNDASAGTASEKHLPQKTGRETVYDRRSILAFAVGKPSEAFGSPYQVFDSERFIARLPGPPYSFLDRVVQVDPDPWVLKPGGWVEAEYDVHPDAWFFKSNRLREMPFCVLLEIALQLCGWVAAYVGSALTRENDLKFRNLDGRATLRRPILAVPQTLTIRSRMTKVSSAGDMIIEQFDMQVLDQESICYEGDTAFGFFSKDALSRQVGLRNVSDSLYRPSTDQLQHALHATFDNEAPLSPDDPTEDPAPSLAMPSKALRMIDTVDAYIPTGGPYGLGYVRGSKRVDPGEWFFKAHFFQDPVCPGSLGIESFLQLMKFMAIQKWNDLIDTHTFQSVVEVPHVWTYRGQIIQQNEKIEIEAVVTRIEESATPVIFADGLLKVDGLYIYQMKNFGLRLVKL
jgi:acyl transferase domain-containing protein/3-hydroxymyristoyl/3-hydroxydecanoyl-(acyl carrier protein) dehydratase